MEPKPGSPTAKDFRLPSGMPLDAGRDQMGNIRDIARETKIPSILERGNFKEIEWDDFVRVMIPPATARDEIIYANIVDTVLFDQVGKVTHYIYTNGSGAMALKSAKARQPKRIYDEFMKISERLQPSAGAHDENKNVASFTTYGSSTPHFLGSASFKSMLTQGKLRDSIVQCFVPSKGDGENNRTYETTYWLDRLSKEHMKTDRLDVAARVAGRKSGPTTVSNKDATNNRLMEKSTEQVVLRIQRSFGCKVVKVKIEFVQDVNGAIWLTRMNQCTVASESSPPRTASPSAETKSERVLRAASYGDTTAKEAASLEDGFGSSRPSSIGRHSDKRVRNRWDAEQAPDEAIVQEIIASGSRQGSRAASRGSSRRSRASSRQSPERPGSTSSSVAKVDVWKTPGSRLGQEVPIADSNTMFGSTQLHGCQGDFCNFDLSFMENQEALSSQGNRGNSLSDFRRKLLVTESVLAQSEGSVNSHLTDLMTGKAKGERTDLSTDLHHADGDDSFPRKIAYRTIMQARQEMPLVKLQLQRHKRGEPGEYVTEQNYQDISVSSRLPAHYYKEVPCCLNCFKVYSVISEARERAVNKLEKEKDRRDKFMLDGDDGSNFSVSGSNAALHTNSRASRELHKRSSPEEFGNKLFSPVKVSTKKGSLMEDSVDSLDDAQSVAATSVGSGGSFFKTDGSGMGSYRETMGSPTSISQGPLTSFGATDKNAEGYLKAAVAAVDSLSKLDVAEIRTMVKPPAAVEVVLEAVMALLTGKSMHFSDTKRLLSGGEAFLVMLREFKLEDVTDARLRLVEPYCDNPVFRPENVLGVSYSASKFCAWVLGVVQAARWQRGLGHKKTNFYENGEPPAAGNSIGSLTTISEGRGMAMSRSVDSLAASTTGMRSALGSSLEDGSIGSLEDTTNLTFVQKLERKKAKAKRGRRDRSEDNTGKSTITRAKEKRIGAQVDGVRERSLSPDSKQSLKAKARSLSPESKKSTKGASTVPPSPIVQHPTDGGAKVPGYSSIKPEVQTVMDESLAQQNAIAV